MSDLEIEKDPVAALKSTFRRHASGVSIITLLDADKKPVGFTATSMTSLGANPPLASFNVACGSSSWPALDQATYVAIHTLGAGNLALAKKMAADHTLRFADSDWHTGPYGLPVFREATSILIGKIREKHAVESNAVIIVDIVEGLTGELAPALLYYERGYMTPGEKLS